MSAGTSQPDREGVTSGDVTRAGCHNSNIANGWREVHL